MFSFQPQYVSMSYVIEDTSEAEALAMYKQCRNKVSKLDANKNYILTTGRRMRTKSETIIGTKLSFLASFDKKQWTDRLKRSMPSKRKLWGPQAQLFRKLSRRIRNLDFASKYIGKKYTH